MVKTTTRKTATKKDQVIRMLKTKAGADVVTISGKLGWQPHTMRAAMTGLRNEGHEIVATKPEGGGVSKYRIIASSTPKQAGAKAENAGAS